MSNKKMSLESLYSNKVKSSFVYKINKLFTLYKAQTSKYFSSEDIGYSEITMFDKHESIRMNNILFMEQVGLLFICTLFVSTKLACLKD